MEKALLSRIRTFEAVARLLSISRAATELHVTPSAVSHQIKALEHSLPATLFHRRKNTLMLTAAGQEYLTHVSDALLGLARATAAIRKKAGEQILRITAPPGLDLWLTARIGGFMQIHPGFEVGVTSERNLLPLQGGVYDVAFWYGSCTFPGMTVSSLGPNRVFPICHPAFLGGEHALRGPVDLARHTLLDSVDATYYHHALPTQPGWHKWLQQAGFSEISGRQYLNFTPRALMQKAVALRIGIGLSRTLLAVDALSAKEIVVPFGPAPSDPATYNIVFPTQLAKRKDVAAFRDWVIAEAHASVEKVEKLLKPTTEERPGARSAKGAA